MNRASCSYCTKTKVGVYEFIMVIFLEKSVCTTFQITTYAPSGKQNCSVLCDFEIVLLDLFPQII